MTSFLSQGARGASLASQARAEAALRARRRRDAADARGKRGMAFVVEALLLLVFLAASVAVFMELFGAASVRGTAAVELDRAVVLATNVGEHFAADPTSIPAQFQDRGYTVRSSVDGEPRPGGVLYSLTATIYNGADEAVYTLETSRYVSDAEAAATAGQEVA